MTETKPTPEQKIAFADAALAVAGHQITDPVRRDIIARFARGEITKAEAHRLSEEHILGK